MIKNFKLRDLPHVPSAFVSMKKMLAKYDLLQNKNIAVVANQTSTIGATHIVDSLISLGIKVKKAFAPEHGFRGTADAGEKVTDGKDKKTGIPILSLYGRKNRLLTIANR